MATKEPDRVGSHEEQTARRVIFRAREAAQKRALRPGVAFGEIYADPKDARSLVKISLLGWDLAVHVVAHRCGIEYWHAILKPARSRKLTDKDFDAMGVVMGELTGDHTEVLGQLQMLMEAGRAPSRGYEVVWFEGDVQKLPAGIYEKIKNGMRLMLAAEAKAVN